MKTLKLFNAVLAKETDNNDPVIVDNFIIDAKASWAKDEIIEYYKNTTLSPEDLNKTFHKSWSKIKNSDSFELFVHQVMHYMSTYGTNFQSEPYLPNETLEIPDLEKEFNYVEALSRDELIKLSLDMLRSGMALKSETINDLLDVLQELNYEFTGEEGIKNKEAIVFIADTLGVYPSNPTEFFRYVIYKATNETLLIKNQRLITLIKYSDFNPEDLFRDYGLEKISTIFNRYKVLFLAFKSKCPATINRISKLSKKNHVPLKTNALNEVTQRELRDEDMHWLENATPYALFKALATCWNRTYYQDTFLYKIRNGKSWVKSAKTNSYACKKNLHVIIKHLQERYNFEGKKFYIPENVDYALPTSEKMFVGNIPMGTKFYGKEMAVGIYWENSWGAYDLDLSGINIGGKIGWNSDYKQNDELYFSGDITNAPNGAVEYLYANKGLTPTLVMNNVYSGDHNSDYKIIVGEGDNIDYDYMMNPNNLMLDEKTTSVQKQTIIGLFLPDYSRSNDGSYQSFVLLNLGFGNLNVSGNSPIHDQAIKATYQEWSNPFSFRQLIESLGGEIVYDANEDVDYDFTLKYLDRDSFIKLFS